MHELRKLYSWKARKFSIHVVNTTAADDLPMQGARTSAATVLV